MSPLALFFAFVRVSLVSVGGATVAWIRDTVVVQKEWLSEESFAEALAVCQLMPGPNAVNLAAFVGAELGGVVGALASVLGLTLLPFLLVLTLGLAYGRVEQGPVLRGLFSGLGAGAAGVALGTAIQMGQKHLRGPRALILTGLVILALALFRVPLVAVVVVVLLVARWL